MAPTLFASTGRARPSMSTRSHGASQNELGALTPELTSTSHRGKRSLAVSLKSPQGISLLRTLLAPPSSTEDWRADILIDPFRPGVLERLGLDPKDLLEKNPRLIVARLTGFRREGAFSPCAPSGEDLTCSLTGPYAKMAGHDINYLALSGVLPMLGRKGDKPYFPANLLGERICEHSETTLTCLYTADFAGGGMMAVLGILAALIERTKSGKGQIVEIDMVHSILPYLRLRSTDAFRQVTGTRYASIFPLTMARPSLGLPMWSEPRGENILDGGAPWYDVYECKDGQYMSLGPIENHFYAEFLCVPLPSSPHSPADIAPSVAATFSSRTSLLPSFPLPTRPRPPSSTAPPGPHWSPSSPPASAPKPATNGLASSSAPTHAACPS